MYEPTKPANYKPILSRFSRLVQSVFAGILVLVFGSLLLGLALDREGLIFTMSSLVAFLASCAFFQRSIQKYTLCRFSQQITNTMQNRPQERLSVLAQATHMDYTQLTRMLRLLAEEGIFPGSYVDLNRREFVRTPGGPHTPLVQGNTQLRERFFPSAAPIYTVGFVFFFYALLFPMYRWMDFLLAAALAAAGCFFVWRFSKPRIVIVEEPRHVDPPKPPEKINTGNEELDEVLTSAMTYMNELTALDVAITSGRIDGPVQELVSVCRQMFDYIRKNPAKVRQLRQFMNYYLPTTIRLLKNYDELSRERVKGDNIKKTMTTIEDAMATILSAFRKQLNDLYEDKAMDISADIAVMQNMMQQEGLDSDLDLDAVRRKNKKQD